MPPTNERQSRQAIREMLHTAESERVASRLIRRGVSAKSASSGRYQPRPAFDRSGLRRARRASGGDGDQVCVADTRQCSMGLDLYVLSTPSATGLRRPEVTSYRKAHDGLGRMRLVRFGCRSGGGTSLSSGKQTEPALTPIMRQRTGAAGLRAQRPRGQGQCAIANAATKGIPHDDVTRAGARNGRND